MFFIFILSKNILLFYFSIFYFFLRTMSEFESESYLFYRHVQNIYLILLLNYLIIKQLKKFFQKIVCNLPCKIIYFFCFGGK